MLGDFLVWRCRRLKLNSRARFLTLHARESETQGCWETGEIEILSVRSLAKSASLLDLITIKL